MSSEKIERRKYLKYLGAAAAGAVIAGGSMATYFLSLPPTEKTVTQTVTTTATQITTSTQITSITTSSPVKKRVVVYAINQEPASLNPNIKVMATVQRIGESFYEKLVTSNNNWEIDPKFSLAESWEASSDAKIWTFHLRKVKWSDGVDFTSADVKWNIENQLKVKGTAADRLANVENVETPDEHTVVVKLKQPDSIFDVRIGHPWSFHILPKHVFENVDWLNNPYNDNPQVGTGPGKLIEWVKGSHLILEWRDNYWGGQKPRNDRVIIKFITSIPTQIQALLAGEIDGMDTGDGTRKDFAAVVDKPGFAVVEHPSPHLLHIDFNVTHKPFDDVRVRKAFAMAIDVEDVLKRVYLGINAIPEPGTYMHHFEANRWAYNPDAKQPTYDPTQAEKLLDEAGYPRGSDGVRFRVRNVVPTVMSFPEAMDIVRTQVAKVGIEMSLEVVEWATYTDKALTRRDHDLTVSAGYQGPDPLEFFSYVGTVKGTPNFRNAMGYYNPEVDQLFTEYAQTVDREARRKAFFRIQEILAEDLPRFNLGAWLGSYARKASLLGSYTDPADFKTSRHWDFGAFYHKDWT